MKFHHIGIACENINEVIVFLENTFRINRKSKIIWHEIQGVDACLLTNVDGTNIELVSGKNIESFVNKKQFLYHSCWEVDDINKSIKSFIDNKDATIEEEENHDEFFALVKSRIEKTSKILNLTNQ